MANPGDMVQFWKKSEIFSVKGNKNDDGDTISESGNNKLEEELVDLDEELRKFVNQEINSAQCGDFVIFCAIFALLFGDFNALFCTTKVSEISDIAKPQATYCCS